MTRIPTAPMREFPAWAVLQRRLFDEIEHAWRLFADRYCEPDGRIRFSQQLTTRDGVDDFYEPFFNWPAFYAMGGSDDILEAAKHHWRGVTAQMTEQGMLTDEFENGYDWFHQGESLIFFYALCAADPADDEFRERARRFAALYLDPTNGNYDPSTNTIRAAHNGALGALEGVDWANYPASQLNMKPYGLPLEHLPGIESWDDLADPSNAAAMGAAMQRNAQGDAAVNLAATSLVVNHWLYDGDPEASAWVLRYVDGWRSRALANDGLLPDNVGPDGTVGGMHDGRWYGGHYGWTWPHGLPSVGMGAVIGAINAALVSGDDSYLDLARAPLDVTMERAVTGSVEATPMSLRDNWLSRLGGDAGTEGRLVPHRYGRDGWFDFGPMPLDLPTWLWWFSRDARDWARLRTLMSWHPESPTEVKPFRDKAEAGHEVPWLSYLAGENHDYPERALSMALGQVARRVALIEGEEPDPDTVHIHFWQRVNPVVTEVLGQLITGAPQVLYNGGLPLAAVSYDDADRNRPGLPPDVAALVSSIDGERITLELVNLSMTASRRVIVRPGRFGERDIANVWARGEAGGVYPGSSVVTTSTPGAPITTTIRVDAPELLVELPPAHRALLVIEVTPEIRPARHHRRASEPNTEQRRKHHHV
ncbi:hypothetical protein ASE14_15715 [Agromyces sp. Root81]|uniref:hypothetical protein n=1 Tax=Agromyces sp. Root81 TaxID=1736601 RepID=UPI0006FD75C9|nr:hypothetical protein [Agromyces sp. Root81]KRC59214.1 hypothetical protein ASE14_15715 [Agromyces sp. Root81]